MLAKTSRHPLLDKPVRLVRGRFKDYYGRLKAVDNGIASIEFEAVQGRRIQVPIDDVQLMTEQMLKARTVPVRRERTPEPDCTYADLTSEERSVFASSGPGSSRTPWEVDLLNTAHDFTSSGPGNACNQSPLEPRSTFSFQSTG